MAGYKTTDPVKGLEIGEEIPQSLIDLPQIIVEKQARKIWGRGFTIDSENETILQALTLFANENRLHEQIITIEELTGLFGQTIVTLDVYTDAQGKKKVLISYADPYMLSRIGKFHVKEEVASVFKYIIRDTKTYPVYEEGTKTKVKRYWYLPTADVQVDSLQAPIDELKQKDLLEVEETTHNLGCLPIVELRNKQKGIYELMSPWSGKPQLATWYPVRGMIKFAYHTLRQIGKNMILVKPRVIGEFKAQDVQRLKSIGELKDMFSDFFINLKGIGGVPGGEGANLSILQGEMNIRDGFEGFQAIYNHILLNCGFSPDNQSETMKTTSEIHANQNTSKESISLLKQLRLDQGTRLFDKVLIILGLWNGEGERPYTLSIPEDENMNKTLEHADAKARIEANLSNYVDEIAKIKGVSKREAERLLKENIRVNKGVFSETKEMKLATSEVKDD